MKRIGKIGLCLAAVFAVSAVFAGGALAAKHVNKGPLMYTSTSKVAKLEQTGGVSKVECQVSESVGQWNTATEGTVTVTFHGCEAIAQKCHSSAEPLGTIKTEVLKTTLGWIDKGTKKAGVSFTANGLTDLADYECPGATPIKEKSQGGVIGEPTPTNVSSTTAGIKVEGVGPVCRKVRHAGKGTFEDAACTKAGGSKEYEKGRFQEFEHFEGGPNILLESEVSEGGGAYSPAEGIQNVAGSEQVNTPQFYKKGAKTLEAPDPGYLSVKGATPEMGRCRAQKHGKWNDAQCSSPAEEKKGKFKGHFEFVPIPG